MIKVMMKHEQKKNPVFRNGHACRPGWCWTTIRRGESGVL